MSHVDLQLLNLGYLKIKIINPPLFVPDEREISNNRKKTLVLFKFIDYLIPHEGPLTVSMLGDYKIFRIGDFELTFWESLLLFYCNYHNLCNYQICIYELKL
jgi:hypothetical protein